ncbi:glucan biosynthesis protein [Yoonia sp. 208BN28-4]|uniref:glucan biosynthesis protein n=1 Tax=Yoonia sp. 208BN28-4 TaxID=3126505 RepID=UPI0030A6CF87
MISRRALLAGLGASIAAPAFAQTRLIAAEMPFSPDMVLEEARALAQADYTPVPLIPEEWLNLTYDEFGHIWFDARNAIWVDEDKPVKVDLFTAGLYVPRPVQINIVEDGTAKTLGYDFDLFDKTDQFPDLPVDDRMGYSGFRLRAGLNSPEIFEEFMVFQGASYFRAIANGQTYGLSARGLALRTADPGGEEFPDFTKFWIEAPAPDATTFIVHALLDGPSSTGAYRFAITPGDTTQVEVEMTVFPRVDLTHVGIAPLTSMFFFDETNRHRFDDFRPAVHDSEGLLIWNGNNERIWRPLANPKGVEVSAFGDENPRGFGLMQRDRKAEAYADLEAHYEARPSLWITPHEGWGAGAVELIEIPADKEIYDNIVAYWRPRAALMTGSEHRFTYHMAWGDNPDGLPDVTHVTNTRIGKGFDQIKTVCAIDFADHPAIPDDLITVQTVVTGSAGTVSGGILQRNPGTGGIRFAFSLLPEDATSVELRAQLFVDDTPISEVWLYRWTA